MKLGTAFDFDLVCPHCGKLNDAMTGIDQEPGARPAPGAAILCIYCKGWSILTNTGLREATTEERREIMAQLIKSALPKVI